MASDAKSPLRDVVLAHISHECNKSTLVRKAVTGAIKGLGEKKPIVHLAQREESIDTIRIDRP